MNAIFHRTSIRKYTDQPIPEEMIEKLLRAAMAAPSACNQQPWEFYLVTDPEKKEKLSHVTPYTLPAGRAPLVIVPCSSDKRATVPHMIPQDMAAATENILLEADELGLGAVWMGVTPLTQRMKIVSEVLELPEELKPFCMIAVGYPDEVRPQQDRYQEERIHRV